MREVLMRTVPWDNILVGNSKSRCIGGNGGKKKFLTQHPKTAQMSPYIATPHILFCCTSQQYLEIKRLQRLRKLLTCDPHLRVADLVHSGVVQHV